METFDTFPEIFCVFVTNETSVADSYAATMTAVVRLTLASVVLGMALSGCSESTDTTRLWIGPERVECEGVAPMMCLQVAESEDGDYRLFYDTIEGFDYQEGTSYVIDVSITEVENPPADASSLQYTLVEIVEES
jgi:hypothetical protein